jgi:hypothetical protein
MEQTTCWLLCTARRLAPIASMVVLVVSGMGRIASGASLQSGQGKATPLTLDSRITIGGNRAPRGSTAALDALKRETGRRTCGKGNSGIRILS